MANKIKGLTVEIGGDTTQLSKALEDVNKKSKDLSSELGEVNKLLKMDPGNADLLAQKQKILAEAVTNTSKKLETLKEAERQVQQQFERGEVSEEQVRALKREIIETERKMRGYENAVEETAREVENLGEQSRAAENASEGLGDTLDNIANVGLATLTGVVTAAAGALVAAAESTREYRTEMAKLDTAFTDNGHTSEAAMGAYRELQGVLGDTDQAVEAANHLAVLTDNEKDLATWTGDILPGIFATFGASLPIEGLTEAANETAKVGEVTGPLADALNWAGISEDKFNESLAKCTSEQERQQLIMETLASTYGDASAAYKETNADVIAANKANEAWMAALAEVGAAVEPLITQVKEMGAELLTKLVPVIETVLANLPAVATALAGIAAALVSYKVAAIAATAAEKGMTLAQYAAATAQKVLNAAMLANPIGLIILAITALVTAFVYLWNNSEKFREFWIKLWDKIRDVTSAVADWFKELPGKIHDAIKPTLDRVKKWGDDLRTRAKTAASNAVTNAVTTMKEMPGKIWSSIVGAVDKVKTWGTKVANQAKTSATNMLSSVVNTLKNLPGKIYSAISGAIQNVAKWGTDMVSKAKSGMSKVVSTVTETLKSLPKKVLSIGSDLVTGLWNGVKNKLQWLKNKLKSFTTSVLDSIKGFFGVNSPARSKGSLKTTDWVGEMLDEGLAVGLTDNADAPIDAMAKVTSGVLGAAQTFDGLSVERGLQRHNTAAQAAAASSSAGISGKLDAILAAIERGQVITIDKDVLIGETAVGYDSTLGRRRALVARGAL